jgi:hypothetical protein|tara:strand:+ start:956 stop:1144 length:189 start_codon:yes stop_codon:yes gene_type:complete
MSSINNNDTSGVNRGVELILKKRRESKPKEIKKPFFSFLKMFSLFKREIKISFSIDVTKKLN